MSDLPERLRNWEAGAVNRTPLYDEAADRIEKLEAALKLIEGTASAGGGSVAWLMVGGIALRALGGDDE